MIRTAGRALLPMSNKVSGQVSPEYAVNSSLYARLRHPGLRTVPQPVRLLCCSLIRCVLLVTIAPGIALAENDTLDVALMLSSGEQRSVFNRIARELENHHPELDVEIHAFGESTYKQHLSEWLETERFHVMYWHAGQRLRHLVESGHAAPLESAANGDGWNSVFPDNILRSIRFGDYYYAVPYSYYPWGFFHHRGLFRDLDLERPESWEQLLDVAEKLKKANITPFVIGSREQWPVAGWFDYLNLRLNGADYHRALLAGEIPFTDSGVEQVLQRWAELLDRDYFNQAHESLSWKAALPLLYRRNAGMMLMGSFAGFEIPRSQRPEIGFFGFPEMASDIPRAEDAPTDIFFLPAHASDHPGARAFLEKLRSSETQSRINNASGMLSPHKEAGSEERLYIAESRSVIARARKLTQFLDRDAPEAFATPALGILQDFMAEPDVGNTQKRLEQLRQSVFLRQESE